MHFLTSSSLAILAQTYVAGPLGEVMLIPLAVMSSHSCEHSRSTTTVPSAPEDVPVTLMSRIQDTDVSEPGPYVSSEGRWDIQWMSEIESWLGYSAQVAASVM